MAKRVVTPKKTTHKTAPNKAKTTTKRNTKKTVSQTLKKPTAKVSKLTRSRKIAARNRQKNRTLARRRSNQATLKTRVVFQTKYTKHTLDSLLDLDYSNKDFIFEHLGIYKTYAHFGLEKDCLVTNRPELYVAMDNWIGVPYVWGGGSTNGVDCSRFVMQMYNNIYKTPLNATAREMYLLTEPIEDDNQLQEGDLVFFKIGKSYISHVGIYLCNNKFIHASSSKGVTISSLNEPYFRKHYFKSGRLHSRG